ncbi:hypothetical protein A2U01_0117575, partial [Trifolium medium]|nr:hypothetical protein [Trifolium medium]
EPDAAPAVLLAVVVAVALLLPGLPVSLSPPSGNMCDQKVAQQWISRLCPPQ